MSRFRVEIYEILDDGLSDDESRMGAGGVIGGKVLLGPREIKRYEQTVDGTDPTPRVQSAVNYRPRVRASRSKKQATSSPGVQS